MTTTPTTKKSTSATKAPAKTSSKAAAAKAKAKAATKAAPKAEDADEPAGIGHNNPPKEKYRAGAELASYIERIERLEEEKKAVAEDIKEVYAQAKAVGFDTKIMRIVARRRKMDKADLLEQEQLVETYELALEGRDLADDDE